MPEINEELLSSELKRVNTSLEVIVLSETESTNNYAKKLIKDSGFELGLIAASSQTGGRGTKGRKFFSPKGGAYFSIVLPLEDNNANGLTAMAAVAASLAFESVSEKEIFIKWINDIIIDDKKACGILVETVISPRSGKRIAVIGIGANINHVAEIPEELSGTISFACDDYSEGRVEKFIAEATSFAINNVDDALSEYMFIEYKKRLCMLNRPLYVIKTDKIISATALDIQSDYKLVVQYDDGNREILSCDEISLKI